MIKTCTFCGAEEDTESVWLHTETACVSNLYRKLQVALGDREQIDGTIKHLGFEPYPDPPTLPWGQYVAQKLGQLYAKSQAAQEKARELWDALESMLRLAVQSDEFNDEQCPQEIKDRVNAARVILKKHGARDKEKHEKPQE